MSETINLAGGIADGRDRTRRGGTGRVNPAQGQAVREQQQAKDRHSGSTDSSRVIRPVSLKQFLFEESQRHGVSPSAIYARIERGLYRGKIKLKRLSKRTVLVEEVQYER